MVEMQRVKDKLRVELIDSDHFGNINRMKRRPLDKALLCVPLCRLQPMTEVRPPLRCDVLKLMDNFNRG